MILRYFSTDLFVNIKTKIKYYPATFKTRRKPWKFDVGGKKINPLSNHKDIKTRSTAILSENIFPQSLGIDFPWVNYTDFIWQ